MIKYNTTCPLLSDSLTWSEFSTLLLQFFFVNNFFSKILHLIKLLQALLCTLLIFRLYYVETAFYLGFFMVYHMFYRKKSGAVHESSLFHSSLTCALDWGLMTSSSSRNTEKMYWKNSKPFSQFPFVLHFTSAGLSPCFGPSFSWAVVQPVSLFLSVPFLPV